MLVLAQEGDKSEEGKAARVYRKLIDIGHLAEELTWIVEIATKSYVQAIVQNAKDSKEIKRNKSLPLSGEQL